MKVNINAASLGYAPARSCTHVLHTRGCVIGASLLNRVIEEKYTEDREEG